MSQEVRRGPALSSRGVFITFEGGDGVGKTTQIKMLAEWLRGVGVDLVVTRNPGGTDDLGVMVRQFLLAGSGTSPEVSALLFAADRGHHVLRVVRPALESGQVVLCDRYTDSSVAYQGGGMGLDPTKVADLSAWATNGLVPDLTILLDAPEKEGRLRRSGRGDDEDNFESKGDLFHRRVRESFLRLARDGGGRYLVLDATDTAENIHAAIRARVAELLAAGR